MAAATLAHHRQVAHSLHPHLECPPSHTWPAGVRMQVSATFCDARKENQKAVLPRSLPARFWLVLQDSSPGATQPKEGHVCRPHPRCHLGRLQLLPRRGGWVAHSSASCSVTQGRGPGLAPRPGTAAASGFHLWVTLPAPWLLQSFIHPPSKIPKRFPLPRRTPKEEPRGLGRAKVTWKRETAVVTPSGAETERDQEGVSLCTCHL